MDKRPIVFLDSGLGSLPYGNFFYSRNQGEKLICVADRANFPYGTKSRDELTHILDSLASWIISRYEPKILALVCNSASVSALDFLRARYPALPIVGTVPAIKPAVMASKTRRVGVLGTSRTIEDPYIRELSDRYGPDCDILGEAAPELVEFVEHRYSSSTPSERLEAVTFYINKFRTNGADSLVLACTHFLLLLDEFRTAAGSGMGVYDSVEGISRRVEAILDNEGGKLRAGTDSAGNTAPFISITGENPLEPYWEQLSRGFGFILEKNL